MSKKTDNIAKLWEAATTGDYPPDITAHDLAECEDTNSWTALHTAATTGQLPPNTVSNDLRTTKRSWGNTPWDCLVDYAKTYPVQALALPNTIFQNDTEGAIEIANAISFGSTSVKLKAAAAIWLAHVIANTQSTPIAPIQK